MLKKASAGGVPQVMKQIEQDVDRTFPSHPHFCSRSTLGTASLVHVLRAYSIRNPMVGYCQSLNFIAGLLLIVMGLDNDEVCTSGPFS